MTIYKAGQRNSKHTDRNAHDLKCICWELGDRDVFVDECGPYCIVIKRDHMKLEFGEGPGVNTSEIQICWLKQDCIVARKGSRVYSCGTQYKLKESPVDMHDGWICANAQLTCENC